MRTKPDPQTTAFGIDIGKKVFHVVALNAAGAVIQRAKFSRDTLMAFFDAAPKALIGMEACPGSQWLARRLAAMGHDARIIPARFVKPYVKSNKTDTVDAAAIAEAVTRPTMRFVEVRTPEQVDLQALHRIRDRLVGQRTALMNQARAFCIEYGLAMRVGEQADPDCLGHPDEARCRLSAVEGGSSELTGRPQNRLQGQVMTKRLIDLG